MIRRALTISIALAVFVPGIAPAQDPPNSRPTPPAPARVEAPKAVPGSVVNPAEALPVDPKAYVIGPTDVLYINVWRENDYTRPVAVRPDGKITMPLIGDMQAADLTPERLSAQLTQALSVYINKPQVEVTVTQVNSKTFSVTGGVGRPGKYPLGLPTRVFDALNAAGGFKDFANKKDILIIHTNGKPTSHFSWNDFVKGKKQEQNILLENGDTIIVKE